MRVLSSRAAGLFLFACLCAAPLGEALAAKKKARKPDAAKTAKPRPAAEPAPLEPLVQPAEPAAEVALPMPPPPAPAPKPEPAVATPAPAEVPAAALPPPSSVAPPSRSLPRLVVLGLQAGGGVDPTVASGLTDAVSAEIGRKGYFVVMSQADIGTIVSQERQKQMVGCTETSAMCMEELAGAVGARFVMSGQVTRLGEAYQLSLQTLDTQKAAPLGRSTRIAAGLEELQRALPYAVAEATATPPPKPPSRVLPYTLMAVGGGLVLGGGVWGLQAFGQEEGLVRELAIGETQESVLKTRAYYDQEHQRIGLQKTEALIAIAAGAVALGVGFLINPSDSGEGPRVALVPSGSGVALAGVLP